MMMKKLLFTALLCAVGAGAVQAQVPKDVQDFTSHGIHVILRSTKANQVVSGILGFEGGLAYGETNNPALSGATAGVIAESGSDKYPKEKYRDELAKLSTEIAGAGGLYHMTYTLQTIRPNFDKAWDIFSNLLTHPHFDTLEAEKLREQAITAIQGRSADPESYTSFLLDSIWKGSSRLNRVPVVSDVESLTMQDLINYRNQQFQRSRALLVLVGDVSRAEVEKKLAALEALPQGSFSAPHVEKISPVQGQYLYIARDLPTTYVEMRSPSAAFNENDWWAERVLFQVLDKRLFDEIRTKRNLSYTPSAYPNGDYQNFSTTFSYQSILPDSAARVLYSVVRDLQNNLVPQNELANAKASRITTYYFATQKNLQQATALYNDQVEGGDWRLFFQIVPETQKVTAQQVRDVAKKYFNNFSFVVMGPEGHSTREVYQFQ